MSYNPLIEPAGIGQRASREACSHMALRSFSARRRSVSKIISSAASWATERSSCWEHRDGIEPPCFWFNTVALAASTITINPSRHGNRRCKNHLTSPRTGRGLRRLPHLTTIFPLRLVEQVDDAKLILMAGIDDDRLAPVGTVDVAFVVLVEAEDQVLSFRFSAARTECHGM